MQINHTVQEQRSLARCRTHGGGAAFAWVKPASEREMLPASSLSTTRRAVTEETASKATTAASGQAELFAMPPFPRSAYT